jgi:hypothetical protein
MGEGEVKMVRGLGCRFLGIQLLKLGEVLGLLALLLEGLVVGQGGVLVMGNEDQE